MRQFQKLLAELKGLVSSQRPGDALVAPPLLSRIELNGVKCAYVQGGVENTDNEAAPPVVFLHGFGGFFMDWPRVMAPVAKHTRVYAIDLPGWGFSDPNEKVESIEDDARTVGEFLKKMNLENAILCGISYGGGVAWAAAAMRLPRVRQVVLLNPMPPYPLRFLRSPIYRTIFYANSFKAIAFWSHRFLTKAQYKIICRENLLNHRLLDTFYLDLAYMVMKQPKMPFILSAFSFGARTMNWQNLEQRLADVQIPVSILQGTEDKIFSMESALYLHRLIPTSELIRVPDCGHAMVFDQHKKVSEHLIRVLSQAKHERETRELSEPILRKNG